MVSIPVLGTGGRQFESGYPDITNMLLSSNWLGHYSFTVEISGSSPVWSTKNKKNREVAQLVRARIWILVKESNSNVLFMLWDAVVVGSSPTLPAKIKQITNLLWSFNWLGHYSFTVETSS